MIERFSEGGLTWINLTKPTIAEVQEVMEECSLPPMLMNDLTLTVPQTATLCVDRTIKITMDFPVVKRIIAGHPHEVKFLISPKSLVTVQYEEMEALDRLKKEFEIISTLSRKSSFKTGMDIFLALMYELYASSSTKLDYIESILGEIEAKIFEDNERQMVIEIAQASKKIISLRHTLQAHDDVFLGARPLIEALYKKTYSKEIDTLEAKHALILRRSNALFEILTALHATNSAMLNTKQNEVMKILTIMAFITFPLSLFTSLFGMNTTSTPITGSPGDFWIIVLIMTFATIGFFAFFKHKNWM